MSVISVKPESNLIRQYDSQPLTWSKDRYFLVVIIIEFVFSNLLWKSENHY